MEATAASLVLGWFAILQFLLGGLLLTRPSVPARAVAGLVLVLNGGVATAIAIERTRGGLIAGWGARLDDPTGAFLLLLAGIAWRSPLGESRWTKRIAVGFAGAVLVGILAPTWNEPAGLERWARVVFVELAIWAAYAFAILAGIRRANASDPSGLYLGLAFLPRALEWVVVYGRQVWEISPEGWSSPGQWGTMVGLATLLAVLVPSAILARGIAGRRWLVLAAAGGVLIGIAQVARPVGGPATEDSAWYAISVLTLFAVRPPLLAIAFEGARAWRLSLLAAAAFATYVLAKGLVAALIGSSFFELGPYDAVAVALCLALAPAAMRRRGALAAAAAPPNRRERVLDALLASDASGLTTQQIAERASVPTRSLASILRTIEEELSPQLPDGAKAIEVRETVRRAKMYALTSPARAVLTVQRSKRS